MKKIIVRATFIIIALLITAVCAFVVPGLDNSIKISTETLVSDKVNNTVRIVAVADLHGTSYEERQCELMQKIKECKPDFAVLLGDIFDSKNSPTPSYEFLEEIAGAYHTFAIHGNHEHKLKDHMLTYVEECYNEQGIRLLTNESVKVQVGDTVINICGADPGAYSRYYYEQYLNSAMIGVDTSDFTLLLNHRPDLYNYCMNRNIDLMLSGHAHGGQWIIPGAANGLYAPNQGFLPEYAGGRYELPDGMTMIVSRGLAISNTIIPRVYNPPELNLIILEPKNK